MARVDGGVIDIRISLKSLSISDGEELIQSVSQLITTIVNIVDFFKGVQRWVHLLNCFQIVNSFSLRFKRVILLSLLKNLNQSKFRS